MIITTRLIDPNPTPELFDVEILNIQVVPTNSKPAAPKKFRSLRRNYKVRPRIKLILGYGTFILFAAISMSIGFSLVFRTALDISKVTCPLTFSVLPSESNSQSSRPRSIATDDLNGDGFLDLVIANSNSDSIGISLGLGDGRFSQPKIYSTGTSSTPYSVAIGDVNGDHQSDIAVANFGTHTILIFFGFGNGTFILQNTIFTGVARPIMIALGQLNKDRYMDLVVVNYGTQNIDIYLARTNGNFSLPIHYSTGDDSIPWSLALADLNDDQCQDIVVTNVGTNNVAVFLNRGDGKVFTRRFYSTGINARPNSVAVGDVNNDTYLDLIISNAQNGTIVIWFGHDQGIFERATTVETNTDGQSYIVVDDFNRDSILDIAISSTWMTQISILLGIGNGTFILSRKYFTGYGSFPLSLVSGDFNRDGRQDLVVINNAANNIGVFLGYDSGSFELYAEYETGPSTSPKALVLADFNEDTIIDIVVGNMQTDTIGIYLGNSDGSYQNQTIYSTGLDSSLSYVTYADLNNDQHLDLIITASSGNYVGFFFGNGTGSFENLTVHSLSKDSSPHMIVADDINHDSNIDLVIGKYGIANIGVLLGRGDGQFDNETIYVTDSITNPEIVALADMNNDTHIDIIVADSLSNNFSIFYGNGSGQYTNVSIYTSSFGLSATSLAIDDINGDGHLDIVIAYSLSHNIGIFLGFSNTTFVNTDMYATDVYSPPYSIKIADFNHDQISDLIVANHLVDAIGIFHGFGNGSFTQQNLYSTGNNSGPWAIATHDFNDDQRVDVVLTLATSNYIAIFLGYDHGDLRNQVTFNTGAATKPISMATADFNHDHSLDLAIVNYGTGTINIRFGYQEQQALINETVMIIGDGSLPSSIAVGDFNGDGHSDFVTANFGSSSISIFYGDGTGAFRLKTTCATGSNSQPIDLAVGYLNDDSWLDIAVVNLITDNIAIFFGYQYISFTAEQSYPVQILSHPLALVVGDFNNDQIIDIATSTDGQASGCLFLGTGNGTYAAALPFTIKTFRDAQLIIAADWNRDRCLDLITVNAFQSFFSIFLGDCNGSFDNLAIYSIGNQSFPTSIIAGDFNEDNNVDIALATSGTNTISLFFNDGNGHFINLTTYSTGLDSNPNALVVEDFNQDHHLDIAVTNYRSQSMGIFLGYGNGSFAELVLYSTGSDSVPNMINTGDFNEDNLTDIVIVDSKSNRIGVFLNIGHGSFTLSPLYSINLTSRLSSMSINDFNNDHLLDIVVTSSEAAHIQIYYGKGDGTFGLGMTQSTGAETSPMSLVVADLNNDEQKDLVVANYASSSIAVFFGYCCEPFVSPNFISIGELSNPRSIVLADLNDDERMDLIVTKSNEDSIGIFFGYGDGTFTNQTSLSTGSGSYPISITIGDINNDQSSDILVANYYRQNIGIFLNDGNCSFSSMINYTLDSSSRPSSITTHDIDGDKRLDVIVTDDGTNSVFLLYSYENGTFLNRTRFATGFNSGPRSFTIGDFNNDTNDEIAVALFGSSRIGLIGRFC